MSTAKNKASRSWQVGRDQLGNAVLEWNPRTRRAERVEIYEEPEPDALERTYNLLKRLDCNLVLEDALSLDGVGGHDPYNMNAHRTPQAARRVQNSKG